MQRPKVVVLRDLYRGGFGCIPTRLYPALRRLAMLHGTQLDQFICRFEGNIVVCHASVLVLLEKGFDRLQYLSEAEALEYALFKSPYNNPHRILTDNLQRFHQNPQLGAIGYPNLIVKLCRKQGYAYLSGEGGYEAMIA